MSTQIDWKNHAIGFIATIIGIIIGLNLDERQNENETQRRLRDFNKLINSEIKTNIANLDTLLDNSHKYELRLRFLVNKNIEDNVIHCTQKELDSVNNVRTRYPFIINYDKITVDKFRVYYAVSTFDFDYQNTVWESFKSTDLINNMAAEEITTLTNIYLDLVKKSKEINDRKEQIWKLTDGRRTDKSLSSLGIKDYLSRLIDLTSQQNLVIDQYLIQLKGKIGSQHKTIFPEQNWEKLKESKEGFR